MKLIYTIKIFEFTLTKNGHFVLSVYIPLTFGIPSTSKYMRRPLKEVVYPRLPQNGAFWGNLEKKIAVLKLENYGCETEAHNQKKFFTYF